MTDEAIIPSLTGSVKGIVKSISDTQPEGREEKDEIGLLGEDSRWQLGLKPYLETRIEILEKMVEVDLDGKETLEEIGTRFVICSAVAQELESIIAWVEASAMVTKDDDNNKKDTKKKS